MNGTHHYSVNVKWTGNRGTGTSGYAAYDRRHIISIAGKPDIHGSSDTPFRGDATRHNPEDMLVSALATCHMLWYLHLCADAGIVVTYYEDKADGRMVEDPEGGHFKEVILHPVVTVTDGSRVAQANALHDVAHKKCFIANSVNFPVRHEPTCLVR